MTSSGEAAARDLQWRAQSLRLSALWPSAEIGVPEAWAGVMGTEPELTTSRKGIEQRAEGGRPDAEGDQAGQVVALVARPDRIEWTLARKLTGPPEDPFDLTLGNFADALAVLTEIGTRWMASAFCPSAQRLALGGVLLAPVEDRQEGYRKLAAYLPAVAIDAERSSDFSYQINRPRITRTLGIDLAVNRLCKWSVASFQTLVVALSGGGKSPVSRQQTGGYGCHLELDINTKEGFAEQLAPDQMAALLAELASYATEISQEGDRP